MIRTATIRAAVARWTTEQLADFVRDCLRPTMLDHLGRFNARCIAVARAELARRTISA